MVSTVYKHPGDQDVRDSSTGELGNLVITEGPLDYQGAKTTFENADVSTTRVNPATQPSTGARVVTIAFIDAGATAADASLVYVTFNADSDADAATKLGSASTREVVLLGERRIWTRAEGSEITRIDFLTDIIIGASNNLLVGEYII